MHTVALTADNKVVTWGVNDEHALGRDTTWDGGVRDMDAESDEDDEEDLNLYESTPAEIVMDYIPKNSRFVQVAAGDSCSFVVTDDGMVFGWGTFLVSSTPSGISSCSIKATLAHITVPGTHKETLALHTMQRAILSTNMPSHGTF